MSSLRNCAIGMAGAVTSVWGAVTMAHVNQAISLIATILGCGAAWYAFRKERQKWKDQQTDREARR